ncbi:MAG: superoxide dismutase, Ni [Candidatus Curtissbacteria bacterium]|nr:superoxide dismutase, Ni [Candidatus Curtissbacteria bacterium]
MLALLLRKIDKVFVPKVALAHCDVPCGIYDPRPAQIAAETVRKMVEKIEALPKENQTVGDRNLFVRAVLTKEEHARKCKEELFVLWADFFKPEHLESFPNLHETFWKAVKLCSKNKQDVNMEAAEELIKAVDEISGMFAKAKDAAKK